MNRYISTRKYSSAFILVLLAAAFTWAMDARAQTGEDALRFTERSPAVGARMIGMAGAGLTAGIADQSALLYNPAGLGYFAKSMVSGALTTIDTRDESLFSVPGFSNMTDENIRDTRLANLAYIAKAPTTRGSLVFGATFNQVNSFARDLSFEGDNASSTITQYFMPLPDEFEFDLDGGEYVPVFFRDLSFIAYETFAIDVEPSLRDAYLEGDVDVPFLPAVTRGTMFQMGDVTEEGTMNEVSFGGAVEAARGVMTGASVNLAFGRYRFNRLFVEDDVNDANNGVDRDSEGFVTVPFEYLEFGERFETDLIGVNARAGLSADLSSGLRLGLNIETPTFYAVNEEYSTTLDVFFTGESYSYGRDADDDAGAGSYEYEILTPWRLGAGLTYTIAGLTAAVDAEFIDWTQLELRSSSEEDDAYFDEVNRDIRDLFRGVVNTRFGLEYALGDLTLRTGIAVYPDPRDYETTKADNTEFDRTKTYFSAGIGYRFAEQLQIDFGWMQQRFEDQYLPYSGTAGAAPIVDEDVVRNRFTVGLSVFF